MKLINSDFDTTFNCEALKKRVYNKLDNLVIYIDKHLSIPYNFDEMDESIFLNNGLLNLDIKVNPRRKSFSLAIKDSSSHFILNTNYYAYSLIIDSKLITCEKSEVSSGLDFINTQKCPKEAASIYTIIDQFFISSNNLAQTIIDKLNNKYKEKYPMAKKYLSLD